MADRVQEVGLTEAGVAIDEQWVVRLGGGLGDRDCGGMGKAVARADDECLEGVLGVQPSLRGPGIGVPGRCGVAGRTQVTVGNGGVGLVSRAEMTSRARWAESTAGSLVPA